MIIDAIANWAKLREDNRDFGTDEYPVEDGQYTVDLVLTEELAKKLEDLGVVIKRTSDEGKPFVRAKKNHSILSKETNEKIILGPPTVVDRMANPWDGSDIGNGSVVKANVELRPYGTGKKKKQSLRLHGLQVVELKTFNRGFQPIQDTVSSKNEVKEELPF